jgi:hypothetical protein
MGPPMACQSVVKKLWASGEIERRRSYPFAFEPVEGFRECCQVAADPFDELRASGTTLPFGLADDCGFQGLPRKSFLPISTPLWRKMLYAVVTWK